MSWNLGYEAPTGWRAQALGGLQMYGSLDTSQSLFVGRGVLQSASEALAAATQLSLSLGLTTTAALEPPSERQEGALRVLRTGRAEGWDGVCGEHDGGGGR